MTDIKVGDVVQIKDTSGFQWSTVQRFAGKCCKVIQIERGVSGYNARIEIINDDGEFRTITVMCKRLVKIKQLAKGTKPEEVMKPKEAVQRTPYVQRDGDVFRMTNVRDVDVAGTLLEVMPGDRFKLVKGMSWVLEYLDQEQDHPHYTDADSVWINELIDAGVIELMKPALAAAFGPVEVDEWSYNPTTFDALAFGEVARTVGESPAFPYVRRSDFATWFWVSPLVRDFIKDQGLDIGEDGWLAVSNGSAEFNRHFLWVRDHNFTFVTAFEYPAMRRYVENAFIARIANGDSL